MVWGQGGGGGRVVGGRVGGLDAAERPDGDFGREIGCRRRGGW